MTMMMPPPFDAEPSNEPGEPLTWREWCLALVVAALAIGALVFGPGAAGS